MQSKLNANERMPVKQKKMQKTRMSSTEFDFNAKSVIQKSHDVV
jgi:hypothetical protein